MSITRVRARLATTHPISAYGGVQLPRQVLDQVASAVASGAMPMHFGHDISRPVAVADVQTGIEQLDDGHFAVWAEFDVDADVWAAHESEVVAAGAPGGMSISFTGPLAGRSLASDSPLVVAADGHHFDDDEIDNAVAILGRLGVDAGGEVLYQFSFEPIAKIIIDIGDLRRRQVLLPARPQHHRLQRLLQGDSARSAKGKGSHRGIEASRHRTRPS